MSYECSKCYHEHACNAWGVKALMKDDKFCDCFVEKENVEFFEHGQWETKRIGKVPYDVCSCCGFKGLVTHGFHEYNYCPFCGAKMDLNLESQ